MRARIRLTLLVAAAAGIWLLTLAGNGVAIPQSFFGPLSLVVTLLSFLILGFERYFWRLPGLRVLAGQPDIRGTWRGVIESSYKNQLGERLSPIPCYVVIDQDFSTVVVSLMTDESVSDSIGAAIARGKPPTLAVVYRNESRQELRPKSPIHYGGMAIRLAASARPEFLHGTYWTDRRTVGDIELTRISSKLASNLAEATALDTESLVSSS
jgi:hypothetical protein